MSLTDRRRHVQEERKLRHQALLMAAVEGGESHRRLKDNSYNAIKEQQRLESLQKTYDSTGSHYDPKSNIERGPNLFLLFFPNSFWRLHFLFLCRTETILLCQTPSALPVVSISRLESETTATGGSPSAPIITHTVATPQGSPNATLESISSRDNLSRLSPKSALAGRPSSDTSLQSSSRDVAVSDPFSFQLDCTIVDLGPLLPAGTGSVSETDAHPQLAVLSPLQPHSDHAGQRDPQPEEQPQRGSDQRSHQLSGGGGHEFAPPGCLRRKQRSAASRQQEALEKAVGPGVFRTRNGPCRSPWRTTGRPDVQPDAQQPQQPPARVGSRLFFFFWR